MSASCPIPTPDERLYCEIQAEAQATLVGKVRAALDEAAAAAAERLAAAGSAMEPPHRDYFAAVLHQRLYCALCGADPDTFAGGRPEIALAMIRNAQNVARHYWGADIPPDAGAPAKTRAPLVAKPCS